MSHTPEERQALLDECIGYGTASEEWWNNALLGSEEMPEYPAQITGDMHSE